MLTKIISGTYEVKNVINKKSRKYIKIDEITLYGNNMVVAGVVLSHLPDVIEDMHSAKKEEMIGELHIIDLDTGAFNRFPLYAYLSKETIQTAESAEKLFHIKNISHIIYVDLKEQWAKQEKYNYVLYTAQENAVLIGNKPSFTNGELSSTYMHLWVRDTNIKPGNKKTVFTENEEEYRLEVYTVNPLASNDSSKYAIHLDKELLKKSGNVMLAMKESNN